MSKPVNPQAEHKVDKRKFEEYELDNHVRTLVEAQKIADDPHLLKAVHKHAKKKKAELHKATKSLSHAKEEMMESPEGHSMESDADEMKEAKSIEDIRSRKKKLKKEIYGAE
jgi:hypothetical protein